MLHVVSFDAASARGARREAAFVRELGPGVALADGFPGRPPIFIRHRFPVQLEADAASLHVLVDTLSPLARRADPLVAFSVQTRIVDHAQFRPRELNDALAARAPAPLDVRHPEQVLSVVVADGRAYSGLSLVADNLSAWAGGERRFSRVEGQLSRSEFKLLEAVEVFGLVFGGGGEALDLGAAPGGWSRILSAAGMRVTAVDPAECNVAGVRHEQVRAQDFLTRAGRYDLIVNDMRMDARDSSRVMAAYAGHMRRAGLITLKLPRAGTERVLAESLRILRTSYTVTGVRQLFHNRGEVTAALSP